jgi:hypothetical protein
MQRRLTSTIAKGIIALPATKRIFALPVAFIIVTVGLLIMTAGSGPASAAEQAESTALTIYTTAQPGAIPPELYRPIVGQDRGGQRYMEMIPGYAIVRQDRSMSLQAGRSKLRFTDVAAQIDPTTVSFASLTDPQGTRVLEQNFEFDLVSTSKLMERFIDREITVERAMGERMETYTGTLLSTSGGLVLRDKNGGIQVISGYSNVQFPELPGGLITRPTLVWDVATANAGDQRIRVTYETKAVTWWADYNIIFAEGENANAGLLDVGAWVSIINQSGATYNDAKLKLIAGDVQRAAPPQKVYPAMARREMAMAAVDEAGFEEKAFFEYHLYTLGRPTTLPDNSTKQIELFPAARGVPCEKVLLYYGLGTSWGYYGQPMTDRNFGVQSNKKVDVYLRFKNEEAIGMGMPLPSGRIRVFQRDKADDSLEFIGEDKIDHTPKNEQVLIKLGSAFDVVGERIQSDFKVDTSRKWMEEVIQIKVRNHKEEPVKVIVKENLYRWVNWEITESTHPHEKIDARTIHFPINMAKDGEVTVRYKVRYSW